MVYFGTLVVARLTTALAISLLKRPVVVDLSLIPVDASNLCGVVVDLKFMLISSSIGTVFGT